jgi:hypothetical protein
MRINPTREKAARGRRGERGAALVTTLLLSTLLLLAGGALIVKTSGSVGVAFDATSEMQAYYAAEAGLQSSLNILRGNNQNAAADKATFAKAVADGGTLAAWLTYDGGRVALGDGGYAYSVVVTDATVPPVAAGQTPRRILVTSTGYGPRGARKELAMLVRNAADIEIPGAVTMRGDENGTGGMTIDLGNSSGRQFLTDGTDPKPVFVTTNGTDAGKVTKQIEDDDKNNGDSKATYDDPPLGNTSSDPPTAELPDFLADTEATEEFIEDMKSMDEPGDNLFIYEGDHEHSGVGTGTMIVTGKLTMNGNFSWNGVIFVLGAGEVEWKGGGNGGTEEGNIFGALFIAKYDPNNLAAGFGDPSFTISGGGKGKLSYDRNAAQAALGSLGFRIVGVQEQ